MKQLIRKIKKHIFCYWCMNEGKHRLGSHYGVYPIDCELGDEGEAMSISARICMCKGHYWEYQNQEGVYDISG
jgi:hypothetical protein